MLQETPSQEKILISMGRRLANLTSDLTRVVDNYETRLRALGAQFKDDEDDSPHNLKADEDDSPHNLKAVEPTTFISVFDRQMDIMQKEINRLNDANDYFNRIV